MNEPVLCARCGLDVLGALHSATTSGETPRPDPAANTHTLGWNRNDEVRAYPATLHTQDLFLVEQAQRGHAYLRLAGFWDTTHGIRQDLFETDYSAFDRWTARTAQGVGDSTVADVDMDLSDDVDMVECGDADSLSRHPATLAW